MQLNMHIALRLTKYAPRYYDMCLIVYPDADSKESIERYAINYVIKHGRIASVDHDLPMHLEALLPLVINIVGKPYNELNHGIDIYNLLYQ